MKRFILAGLTAVALCSIVTLPAAALNNRSRAEHEQQTNKLNDRFAQERKQTMNKLNDRFRKSFKTNLDS